MAFGIFCTKDRFHWVKFQSSPYTTIVYIIPCLESSLRKNFIAKEDRQISHLPSICATQSHVKEAYRNELSEITVMLHQRHKVLQLYQATDAKRPNWIKIKKTWLFPVQLKNTFKNFTAVTLNTSVTDVLQHKSINERKKIFGYLEKESNGKLSFGVFEECAKKKRHFKNYFQNQN